MYTVSADSVNMATGGVFPTNLVAEADAVAPSSSVTVKVTIYVPFSLYECSAVTPVAFVPSPKSQK